MAGETRMSASRVARNERCREISTVAPRPGSTGCASACRAIRSPLAGHGGAARPRPVRQAAAADHPVRHAGGGADLRAVGRQLPHHLADRPADGGPARRAGGRGRARRRGAGSAAHRAAAHRPGARRRLEAPATSGGWCCRPTAPPSSTRASISALSARHGRVGRACDCACASSGRRWRVPGARGSPHPGDRRDRHGAGDFIEVVLPEAPLRSGHDPLRPQRARPVDHHLDDHARRSSISRSTACWCSR